MMSANILNETLEIGLGERQANVLGAIVRQYVKSAEPVGSQTLVRQYHLHVSPATVRNDMLYLEAKGLIASPHPSAGRIPTESGYRYYVKHQLLLAELSQGERRQMEQVWDEEADEEVLLKRTAQVIAGLANETIFISIGQNQTYYTGFRFLFEQPEFRDKNFALNVGRLIDQFDQAVASLFDTSGSDIRILVGTESPFGGGCSTAMFRRALGSHDLLFGILGPIRMDYDVNVARLNFIRNNLPAKV